MSGTNVVAEQITGASSYINSMTGINFSEQNITGANLYENLITSTSITGANLYENLITSTSITGANLYENLITSTSITGGSENINSIVVSSSLFIPTTSSGVTGSTGVGSMYFSSNDNKLHIYSGTGWVQLS